MYIYIYIYIYYVASSGARITTNKQEFPVAKDKQEHETIALDKLEKHTNTTNIQRLPVALEKDKQFHS